MTLPAAFLDIPLAHRALHDLSAGRPENSRAAVRAAVDAGVGIEIDVQLSADNKAMVFHDYALERLTPERGAVRLREASALAAIPLKGGDEGIPTLEEILDLIAGRVPLLVEFKDQDGAMGPNGGPLETAAAELLGRYRGDLAVMSFNPHSVRALAHLLPDVPRGLTTSAYRPDEWPLPAATCDRLRGIPDYADTGSCFISHEADDLNRPRVAELKAEGAAVLCWTIRSQAEEDIARQVAQNVTFEGYLPRPRS
ncbi:MAG: glycerophosphodiester phosphodiesterase family protein [Sulfitobacter sp.]|jgi:glycerophosphoryl diester phosphodiesterase|uniref:Glycerophosphodiester phosphodiesterase family protein n=1 Tax=Sulfitobacter profundi TaxID=2679961 RepID=A0ABW1Z151_9RHOB|nr:MULTISPECIES: glycerophosphodiester phosphodiesterase family protein [Sulfitobacter]AYE84927.1 phosphodiesterase [Sulfitobacter sp. D7]UWR37780.1 phosphodiesterase [Sulfitobacter sp. W074]WOI16099.1 glycerophosphodiester phosphodiesterase family protein [Sulfitobacter sp. LC.270.F.C4]